MTNRAGDLDPRRDSEVDGVTPDGGVVRRTVGIIGGMGPAATHVFFGHIIALTDAAADQEHIHLIIDNDPSIPDRTAFLLGRGEDPLPQLVAAARRLEAAGCDLLVMPCNTASAFSSGIQSSVSIPLVDWTEVAAEAAAQGSQGIAGILATTGTIEAGLYQRPLEERGCRAIIPDPADQERLMGVIYGPDGVKSGRLSGARVQDLLAIAGRLVESGARTIVLGCTELPLAIPAGDFRWPVPAIDPAIVVAERVVIESGASLRR